MYGIVQGGVYKALRKLSCQFNNEQSFFGYGIGGALGVNNSQIFQILSIAITYLLPNHPIHLLGVGSLLELFYSVTLGADTFDCVYPIRLGRHGYALMRKPFSDYANLYLKKYSFEVSSIDNTCSCITCKNYPLSYLHSLLRSKQLLGPVLIVNHNITFINLFFRDIRKSIRSGNFAIFATKWLQL
jgi:queuine tRNA-ribosyltransferase